MALKTRSLAHLLAFTAVLALPACKNGGSSAQKSGSAAADKSDQTLAGVITGADGLKTVSAALKDTGLSEVFDGAASYTLLAPNDAAFARLGDAGQALQKPEQRAALAALLRDHILPGYVTRDDVNDALRRAAGNGVKMKSMGGHVVTFAGTDNAVTVTQEDGSSAKLAGDPLLAGNGVAIPIDGVLKKL